MSTQAHSKNSPAKIRLPYTESVSYTHLDVYKRQRYLLLILQRKTPVEIGWGIATGSVAAFIELTKEISADKLTWRTKFSDVDCHVCDVGDLAILEIDLVSVSTIGRKLSYGLSFNYKTKPAFDTDTIQ